MEQDEIERAVEVLKRGGVVAYPTETVYGLGARLQRAAIERVFSLKGRERTKPISMAVSSLDMMARYVHLDSVARRLIERLAPGPYTFVLPRRRAVPLELTAGGALVGVRYPSSTTALFLIERLGEPITSTSANRSGEAPPVHWSDVELDVDILIRGRCEYEEPSTVIEVGTLRILRRGAGVNAAERVLDGLL